MPLGPGLCLRDMALLSPLIHKYYTHPEGHPSWNFPGHFMSTAPGASDSWDFLWSERAVSLVLFSLVWGNGPEQGYSDIKGSQNSARHSSFQHADHFFFKARADRCPKGDLVLMDSEIAAATGLNTSSSPLCCSRWLLPQPLRHSSMGPAPLQMDIGSPLPPTKFLHVSICQQMPTDKGSGDKPKPQVAYNQVSGTPWGCSCV